MASRPEYVFTRDFLDNARINLMHSLWTKLFGYLVHPKIPIDNPGLRVADVGTGTAVWLLDVGDSIAKSARLDGLDISLNAAPPVKHIPSNVTLRQWDVTDDVPEDLVGVYDVVNVRFFAFVVLNDEIPGLVQKLFKLLKPGGYLQWGEPDMETVHVEKSDPNATTEGLDSLFKLMSVQDPRLKPTWVRKLPQILADSGFVDVETDTCIGPAHIEFMFHEAGLLIYELIARKTKNEQMAKKVEELLPRAAEETRNGCYLTSVRLIFIARKP